MARKNWLFGRFLLFDKFSFSSRGRTVENGSLFGRLVIRLGVSVEKGRREIRDGQLQEAEEFFSVSNRTLTAKSLNFSSR
jgi:hypothetical protein